MSVPSETVERQLPQVADPAPLGLGAFALTTFVLSVHAANWAPDVVWIGLAIFYGGLIQLLAGMWEFRNRNVFGATAFSTYGGFWLGLGSFTLLASLSRLGNGLDVTDALGWFVLAFAIFNSYMLLISLRLTKAVCAVFFTLEITEILLTIGYLQNTPDLLKWGGYLGVVTAATAWYASAAGVANSTSETPILPVGKPFWRDRPKETRASAMPPHGTQTA